MTNYQEMLNPEDLEVFLQRRGVSLYGPGQRAPQATTVPGNNPINTNEAAQQPPAPQAPPKSEMERVMAAIQHEEAQKRKRLEEYLGKARSGMAGLEEAQKAQLQQKAQVDLSPLAALSDSLTPGGKLLSGYQKPPTSQEISQQGLGNLMALQQRREALTKIAEGADGTGSNYLKLLAAQAKDQGTQGRSDRSFVEKAAEEIDNTINKDIFREGSEASFTNMEDAYKQMEDAFSSGDGVAVSAAMGNFARLISKEKGVLSDVDIQRVQPQTISKVMAQWEKFATDNPGVPLPDSYVKPYRELVARSKQNLGRVKMAEIERRQKEKSSRPNYGTLFNDGGYGKTSFGDARKRVESFSGSTQPETITNEKGTFVKNPITGKYRKVK